jgi:hypothetical protein
MAFQRYDYKPLNKEKREIRLIRLLPSEVQDSSQVQCTIFTTSLDDPPMYGALSYRWSDLSNPSTLELHETG